MSRAEDIRDQLLPMTIGSPGGLSSVASTLTRNSYAVEVSGISQSNVSFDNLCEEIEKLSLEDMNGGDGGDSDVEGEEVEVHDFVNKDLDVESSVDFNEEGNIKAKLKVMRTGGTVEIAELDIDDSIGSSELNIRIPQPDEGWSPPSVKVERGEPAFHLVDNPGLWQRYIFHPKFSKGDKDYIGHFLPTGASPCPIDQDGKRKCGDWEFYYKGFKNNDIPFRRSATTANLFPEEMMGSLDPIILQKLGLTRERVRDVDALFFFQLLLPFCDPAKSGVDGDPRIPYYTDVEKYTNASAALSGQGSSYGHCWRPTSAGELLRFDAILLHDGVLGGSDGALYRRWDKNCITFSKDIAASMTLTRYAEIKRHVKLCVNGIAPKRGERNYNPAYKYDLIYKAIVFNTNSISLKADENQVIDETTWGHRGFGESGTGLTGRLRNKKVSKGGQTVLMMDRHRLRLRAYMHRTKIYDELYEEKKNGWTRNGPFELKCLADKLLQMVDGEEGHIKKLFRKKPTITADNYFQSDAIMEYLGGKGLGGVMTSGRSYLPKDIKSEYLHKLKTDPANKYSKIARFAEPIVAVKNDPQGKWQRCHVSFQSTSSCNISTVNALNEVFNYVELRERGRGDGKRKWVIEMNHARRLYLSTYNGIDVLDHLLKNARLFYRTWKYWHAPKNHAIAIAVSVAYDIYCEVGEGKINPDWKVDKPISRWEFQRKLSMQALTYSPKKLKYPGDEFLRANTSVPRANRVSGPSRGGSISRTQLQELTQSSTSRGCGDLDKLSDHVNSIIRLSKGRVCSWCGTKAYQACGLCNDSDGKPVAMHVSTRGGNGKFLSLCFLNYHNDNCIGLAKDDQSKLCHKRKGDWTEPTKSQKDDNKAHVQQLKRRFR